MYFDMGKIPGWILREMKLPMPSPALLAQMIRTKRAGQDRSGLRRRMKAYPSFYQKVWKACALIPRGQTRTYGWIAKKIGSPAACRAVGQALGKNPFAPLIPCHRVIRADGKPGGFSAPGGVKAKKALLEAERRTI